MKITNKVTEKLNFHTGIFNEIFLKISPENISIKDPEIVDIIILNNIAVIQLNNVLIVLFDQPNILARIATIIIKQIAILDISFNFI